MTRSNRFNTVQPNQRRNTEKWKRQLHTGIPIVGGWLRMEAARLLQQTADQGNAQATLILTLAYAESPDEKVREIGRQVMEKAHQPACLDAIWTAWIETRNPQILRFLLEKNWIATAPPQARVYSALRLERLDLLLKGKAEIVDPLIEACQDKNENLAAQARECLANLQDQSAIDALCERWLRRRDPLLEEIIIKARYIAEKPAEVRCYSALLNQDENVFRQAQTDIVPVVVRLCHDTNPVFAQRSQQAIRQLSNQTAIDALCAIWNENRAAWLGDVIAACGYIATQPPKLMALTALKTGLSDRYEGLPPECIPALVEACQDADSSIRKNALLALQHLQKPESQEALCLFACQNDHPFAKRIALEQGYEPRTAENRALYYFLTGQWEKYESLDFDRSLLKTLYETSAPDLRRRLIRQVQAAGRADFLTVLAGTDYRSRAGDLAPAEIETLIKILRSQQDWQKLWPLVFELTPAWSLYLLRFLVEDGWRPSIEADRQIFDRLVELGQTIPEKIWQEWNKVLPLTQSKAHVRVSGRINDVAFSPSEPVIAVATGNRRVALWDYQKAEIRHVYRGFDHSISKVAYLPDGTLLCAERTNSQDPCGVYVLAEKDQPVCLGSHQGSITALEPAGEHLCLSAGRDQSMFLWDLTRRCKSNEQKLTVWARQARVSPDFKQVLVLDRIARLLDLQTLETIARAIPSSESGNTVNQIARSAAFAAHPDKILIGNPSGHVHGYAQSNSRLIPPTQPTLTHASPVQAIEFLADHDILITASADGEIRFTTWSSRTPVGSVHAPGERLTSMCLSKDGAFMATGDSDASFSLWDLRLLDIPNLVNTPFCRFTLSQASIASALAAESGFHPAVDAMLRYMRTVLEYRSRYDIQIDAAPTIHAGEFDIMIE